MKLEMLEKLFKISGIYSLYEKWLRNQVSKGVIPRHIGVVLDGNRRWAEKRGKVPWFGHREGANKVEELIKWCRELGSETLTLFVFSLDNFKRSKEEIEEISDLLLEEVKKAKEDTDVMKHKIRFTMIGRRDMISPNLLREIEELEEKTEENDGMMVNIAFAYDGKQEIVDAAKRVAEETAKGNMILDEIDEAKFQKYLYTSHLDHQDVDMMVRTSGEMRLSGFLLWQSAYSELVFLDVYWPDFRMIDLMRAMRIYQKRRRRFGK